jgi:hypothetical protein
MTEQEKRTEAYFQLWKNKHKLEFKDVAHLYLGCKLKHKDGNEGTLDALYTKSHKPVICYDWVKSDVEFDDVKPMLKRFTALKQEDFDNHLGWAQVEGKYKEFGNEGDPELDDHSPFDMWYLLRQGIDLFELIDRGLAIEDKSE